MAQNAGQLNTDSIGVSSPPAHSTATPQCVAVESCVGARAWLKSTSLTLLEEIMVTAVKMSRPYTAIDLMRRIYRQMYLGEN